MLWIIGNGFDVNLGLRTCYSDFYQRCYSQDAQAAEARQRLEKAFSRKSTEGLRRWADLEQLLGDATEHYAISENSLFNGTFEQMQSLLEGYLEQEQRVFEDAHSALSYADEVWDSIINFEQTLCPPNANRMIPIASSHDPVAYSFMSLNYTTVFDHLVDEARRGHAPFNTRTIMLPNPALDIGSSPKEDIEDIAFDVFHVHGSIGAGDIVFGVSGRHQIANADYANDPDCSDLWVKTGKNALYASGNTEKMKALVSKASVICIYGCSLGETDDYIWKEISSWLVRNSHARLVVFDHAVQFYGGTHGAQFLADRKRVIDRFASAGNWTTAITQTNRDKIIVEPSRNVFKF